MTRVRCARSPRASLRIACARGSRLRARRRDDDPAYLRVAITSSPRDLDPRIGVDEVSQRVHQLVFSPLLKLDSQSARRAAPGDELSRRPTRLTYIVNLRTDVRFHDGSLLTADDVAYTFGSFLEKSFVSGRKGAYRALVGVDAVDPQTVALPLKEPFGSFPIQLVMGIVKRGSKNQSTQPIGTGPYTFVRSAADDRVVLKRFDGYFDGPARNPGARAEGRAGRHDARPRAAQGHD